MKDVSHPPLGAVPTAKMQKLLYALARGVRQHVQVAYIVSLLAEWNVGAVVFGERVSVDVTASGVLFSLRCSVGASRKGDQ